MKNSPYTAPAATPGEWISWAGQVNATFTAQEAKITQLEKVIAQLDFALNELTKKKAK
jgi:hypothetical protein